MRPMAQSPSSHSNFSDDAFAEPTKRADDTRYRDEDDLHQTNKSEQNGCDRCTEYCTKDVIKRILMIWVFVSAIGMALEGLLCLTRAICSSFNLRAQIMSLYYGVFGVVVIVAELGKFGRFIKFFKFMDYRVGRAVFFIFLGTICLGDEVWSYIIAVNWFCLGIASIVAACYCLDDKVAEEQKENEQVIRDHRARKKAQESGIVEPKLKLSIDNEHGQSVNVAVPTSMVKSAASMAYDNRKHCEDSTPSTATTASECIR